MAYVTKDQIERARQVDILDYILSFEPGNVRRVGGSYRLKDPESLSITSGKWFWHSHGFGGRTALDFLTDVRGYGLVEAVCLLIGERPVERGQKPDAPAGYTKTPPQMITPNAKPPPERIPFSPPPRNADNRRVIAYLQSRGIDKSLILDCIDQNRLYESRPYHNAVFTGKDEDGKTRFAAMRGTMSAFKRDADGSDKRYGFLLPPSNPISQTVAVYEAPIDCLSHFTLCKERFIPPFGGWRLSLGGTSTLALEHFLETHPDVIHCQICTDNDEAGELAAAKIFELPGITAERSPPALGNDWNDMLCALQKAERT
jgi:hypothetical protein